MFGYNNAQIKACFLDNTNRFLKKSLVQKFFYCIQQNFVRKLFSKH